MGHNSRLSYSTISSIITSDAFWGFKKLREKVWDSSLISQLNGYVSCISVRSYHIHLLIPMPKLSLWRSNLGHIYMNCSSCQKMIFSPCNLFFLVLMVKELRDIKA